MATIKEIDESLSKIVSSLEDEIAKLNFEKICDFQLNKQQIPEIPWGDLKYPGVYMLEIKNKGNHSSFKSWIDDFRIIWEDEKYMKHFTPNLRKKRIKEHDKLEDWIPIYIGKSRNIEGRIHGHIFKDLYKTTFALKLNARENLKDETFRLSTIKCEVKNYNLVVPLLESRLRNRVNPVIGRQ